MSQMTTTSTRSESSSDEKKPNFLERRAEEKRLKALATWVNQEYSSCKKARTQIEQTWYRNLEMYLGNQWTVWGRGQYANRLVQPKAPPWRTRLTVNRIRPVIRTELSRVTSQEPNAAVVPASSDDEDLFAAQAGEQVWQSVYSRLKVKTTLRRALWWTLITGNGFIKDYWDPNKVDSFNKVEGDLCIQPVTPFHIFVPDLTLEDIEEQEYVIHAQVLPVRKVQKMYPDLSFKPTVVGEDEIVNNARLHISSNNKPDSCLVLEMWLKPGAHESFPKGGLVRVIDEHVVYEWNDGIPYMHGEFPFTKFEHVPTGKFYADSIIVDLDSLQREYNRTRSQIIEAKNRMAKPQLLAVEGSVDPSKITSMPGQVILYKPGFNPPSPLPLQALPAYVLEELNRILADFEDISAQHAVSKGNVPPGVTAATAISYLQEKDDSVLAHTFASVEEGMERIARHVLNLVVQYWDYPRTVKVTGSDGAFDALALKGSDISAGTDIRMEGGSALPTSKAARQAFLMDMMKMGFIPPDKGLELMEMGGVQKLYDQLKVDERQAQRENLRMKNMDPAAIAEHMALTQRIGEMQQAAQQTIMQQSQAIPPELSADLMPQEGQVQGSLAMAGQDPSNIQIPGMESDPITGQPLMPPALVPVNTWDNHAVHIEVHNQFRKSQSFETLPKEVKDLFEQHVQTHSAALNEAAMGAMGGMGVPPVGPPEIGGNGTPPSPEGGSQPPLPGMG